MLPEFQNRASNQCELLFAACAAVLVRRETGHRERAGAWKFGFFRHERFAIRDSSRGPRRLGTTLRLERMMNVQMTQEGVLFRASSFHIDQSPASTVSSSRQGRAVAGD